MDARRDLGAASTRRLWIYVAVGPVAWTAHLLVSYLLLPVACATGLTVLLHMVTLLTALPTAAAGALALGAWLDLTTAAPGAERGSGRQRQWLALAAVLLDALFLLVIVLEGIPNFFLGPCQ
jgi:hypothetical protein